MLAALVLFAGISPASASLKLDELLALHGQALFDATSSYDALDDFSTPDLIKILRTIETEKKSISEHGSDSIAVTHIFEQACNKSSNQELDQLMEIYVQLDPGSIEKTMDFTPLAARWIKRELAGADEFGPLEIARDKQSSLPAKLKDAPNELIDAWRQYKGTIHAFESMTDSIPNKNRTSFQANTGAFFQVIDDVLLKRGDDLIERLAQFGWSGSSGTFSETLAEPRSLATFMALLSEKRTAEAIGAAVEITSSEPVMSDKTDVRVEFLRRVVGLDWEIIFAGAELDCESIGAFGNYEHPYLNELAAYGSDHAAHLLSSMARRAVPEVQATYARAMSAFFATPADKEIHFINGVYDRVESGRISRAVEMELLAALQQLATSNPSAEVAAATLDGFARAKFPGSKPALYALTKHPSPRVASQAAEVLQSMGENVSLSDRKPVRFQLLVNKKPLAAGTNVSWEVNSTSSTTDVSSDGMLELDREDFVDRPGSPATVTLGNGRQTSVGDPIFKAELPPVTNLDSVIPVNIDVFPLRLVIHAADRRSPSDNNTVAHLRVRRAYPHSDEFGDFDFFSATLDLPIGAPTELSIQNGDYIVEVESRGAARATKQFTVSNNMSPIAIHLTPGSDVQYKILRPDGEQRAPFALLRSNVNVAPQYFDSRSRSFHGLPIGEWVLHFPASDKVSQDEEFRGFAPADLPYAARDVHFTITSDSPPVVDLGTILLEPVRAGQ